MSLKPERLLALTVTRRPLLLAAAAAVLVPGVVLAQEKAPAKAVEKKVATVDLAAELMQPGPLPDIVLGKADAPVTIIEYASMTCPHCAEFHNKVLPQLKTKYVDAGQVRIIMREFPLDNLAAAASMLTRCAAGDKTIELIGALFAKQESWAFVQGNPVPALFKIVGDSGFTKESFDKCLTDQKLLDGITATRDRANKQFGVHSTPSFFINGRKLTDRPDEVASFDKAIEPLLKKG